MKGDMVQNAWGFEFGEDTVELRSKGPGSKGNPPIREMISGPIYHFPFYFYISYKRISVYGKN